MKKSPRSHVKSDRSIRLLQRLKGMLSCSLARYLSNARAWVPRRYRLINALVRKLSQEHELFAHRIAHLIDARRGEVRLCVFPKDFTYYNDLSLEFMAPRLLEHQHRLISSAEIYADELTHDREAHELVSQLKTSLRHFEAKLVELLVPLQTAVPVTEHRINTLLSRADPRSNRANAAGQVYAESQTAV